MDSAIGGMASLLTVLSQAAHPDEVAAALVQGPGSAYGARSAAVLWRRGNDLVVHGLHGYRPSEVKGLEKVSLDEDYPLVRAFREGTPLIESSQQISETYAGTRRPDSRWRQVAERLPAGDTVNAPVISNGRPVGVYALNCGSTPDWSSFDLATLDLISHALGMWLSHPDSGIPLDDPVTTPTPGVLTDRQNAVLGLVAQGRSNAAIATMLGVSVSTVKQEVSRIMAHLNAVDRVEAVEIARSLGILLIRTER